MGPGAASVQSSSTLPINSQAAPQLRTLGLGNCLSTADAPDPHELLRLTLAACPRLLMLDVTDWRLNLEGAMAMFDDPDKYPELFDAPGPRQPCLYSGLSRFECQALRPVGGWFEAGRNTPEQLPFWDPNQLLEPLSCGDGPCRHSCVCNVCRKYAWLMKE